ncbi:hypothetical protein BDP55DRAFT_732975 [Colletotrichum godetiae]|uniref:Uncharacterized protein n=1 Tax=Colletotrichum godetiae TaxID=1209918 RepID=A0AAJ0AAY4_9PEZI|nr:uncharacterized protein BDP55DRAFT_732975 [Colletotrichum godetiae]KAK1659796.1 hypothetical protein BDP55DRAFT_732975 [Colletotrichum godetiae]
MARHSADQQALVSVSRDTSRVGEWTGSFVPSHQPDTSAWQSPPPPFTIDYGDYCPRGFSHFNDGSPKAFEPADFDSTEDTVFSGGNEPNPVEEGILDPDLVDKLQIDVADQYLIEQRLQDQDWDTIKSGFEDRFGVSSSSSKSALAMRVSRRRKKHSEIRSLFEQATLKKRSKRQQGKKHSWETGVQDRYVRAEETIGLEHEACAERTQGERRGRPRSTSPKTCDQELTHCITPREAAAAADMLLAFLGQPELRGVMAQADCLSIVRVRSHLREQADVRFR